MVLIILSILFTPSEPYIFSALRDLKGPTKVIATVTSPHYLSPPITGTVITYTLQEKLLSVSGEDFDVYREDGRKAFKVVGSNKVPFGIGGLILDKMVIKDSKDNSFVASVERRALALATAYDIYDNKGKCVCKVEREVLPTLTPTFKFFYEEENNSKPFYKAVGSFSDRNYDIYGRDGKEVAAISRSFVELSDRFDRYGIRMAKGVDPAAIVAMAVVIDETHDEEKDGKERDKTKKKEEKKKGWLF